MTDLTILFSVWRLSGRRSFQSGFLHMCAIILLPRLHLIPCPMPKLSSYFPMQCALPASLPATPEDFPLWRKSLLQLLWPLLTSVRVEEGSSIIVATVFFCSQIYSSSVTVLPTYKPVLRQPYASPFNSIWSSNLYMWVKGRRTTMLGGMGWEGEGQAKTGREEEAIPSVQQAAPDSILYVSVSLSLLPSLQACIHTCQALFLTALFWNQKTYSQTLCTLLHTAVAVCG